MSVLTLCFTKLHVHVHPLQSVPPGLVMIMSETIIACCYVGSWSGLLLKKRGRQLNREDKRKISHQEGETKLF